MIQKKQNPLMELKKIISKEKQITEELGSLFESLEKVTNSEEKNMISSQINSLKNSLKKINNEIPIIAGKIVLTKSLPVKKKSEIKKIKVEKKIPVKILEQKIKVKKIEPSDIEKAIIRRLKKRKEKVTIKKLKKPSQYVKLANNLFSGLSKKLLKKDMFSKLKRELIQTNLQFIPQSYVSVIFLTTLLAIIAGMLIFAFFLFFNLGGALLISPVTENIGSRFIKVFWILFVVPVGTFLIMYFYPSMEKKSMGDKINQELPFATIHMAAISGSMIDPSKIFEIMILTKEYPNIEREFVKLMNEINIYGYDLVSALKKVALNCPSQKLVELFNGLATTITSGGDLAGFFNKRSETLLLEYRLEREKYTKSAETFMDIYISVVIAAPMILMLLLMMMKISGLGVALSTSMITLMMILGVSMINVVFITFLHLSNPV